MAPSLPQGAAVESAGHRPANNVHVDCMARASKDGDKAPNKSARDGSLLRQSVLRRSDAHSPFTAPVTVVPAPPSTNTPEAMRNTDKRASTSSPTTSPPDPAEFAFPTLLSSLGPEADDAIDKIAEICGRSRMSLADSHGAHLPPLGGDTILHHVHREPEDLNSDGVQTRSMSRRLRQDERASTVLEETMDVVQRKDKHKSDSSNKGLVTQILSWLRGSSNSEESSSAELRVKSTLGAEQAATAST